MVLGHPLQTKRDPKLVLKRITSSPGAQILDRCMCRFMHAYSASRCERRFGTRWWSEDEYLHHQEKEQLARAFSLHGFWGYSTVTSCQATMLALGLGLALLSHNFSVTMLSNSSLYPATNWYIGLLCQWVHLRRLLDLIVSSSTSVGWRL